MKTVSMKPVVQKPRKDGFWAVYIRFTYDGRCHFWKTSKVVSSQNVKSKSEITDSYVLSFCSSLILQWMEKLNHVDYSAWSLKDIVEYVTNDDSQVSFSSYARTYIEKIDKPRTAKNYILALKHLEKYMGTCELMFQSLTENSLNAWINTMVRDGKKRAKEMYPVCIRHIWRNAMKELNVPEQGIVRIKYNP
ncbi:MAG: phage integrase SAM-like domain-containing protein [Bacteroidaceae bacterium]|nr:phage integrase SAM-like domain-containing protein [Bacteroidaceae bacterium]